MIRKIKEGEAPDPVESTQKFYNTKSKRNAKSITSTNLNNSDFRSYLLDGLSEKKILGRDSKIEGRLEEGLDADFKKPITIGRDEKTGKPVIDFIETPDYKTRLDYIKEINKIAGVYAPEKRETKSMILTADLTEEQLDEKIANLQEELE